jgi:hypothetical protein
VEERYMGGAFCSLGYSRSAPAPAALFDPPGPVAQI